MSASFVIALLSYSEFSFADIRFHLDGRFTESCQQALKLTHRNSNQQTYLLNESFDELLQFYRFKHHGVANGLTIIDVILDDETNLFGGHAVEVALKLDSTEPPPGPLALVPVKTASGDLVFAFIEKSSRKCVAVALGRGFDEVKESEASYAKSLVGREISESEIWHVR